MTIPHTPAEPMKCPSYPGMRIYWTNGVCSMCGAPKPEDTPAEPDEAISLCPSCNTMKRPWNDNGECITCARDRVLDPAPAEPWGKHIDRGPGFTHNQYDDCDPSNAFTVPADNSKDSGGKFTEPKNAREDVVEPAQQLADSSIPAPAEPSDINVTKAKPQVTKALHEPCPKCKGSGLVYLQVGQPTEYSPYTCGTCYGAGRIFPEPEPLALPGPPTSSESPQTLGVTAGRTLGTEGAMSELPRYSKAEGRAEI